MTSKQMTDEQEAALLLVGADIVKARRQHHAIWGEQDLPDGETSSFTRVAAQRCISTVERLQIAREQSWRDVTAAAHAGVTVAKDDESLRRALLALAATACEWVEAIDRSESI